jgi:ribulose-5-phosphate 4-epimerase/fuculose-1-phosphate aldolase
VTFNDADRAHMVQLGAALYDRGLTPGRTGNLSVRNGEQIMITPTNVSLGRLEPSRLSVVSIGGDHISGDPSSKEVVLHRALYNAHPECMAVAHLHSTSAVAVSCLPDLPDEDALPPITPYYVMRVGRLRVVDYAMPGSTALTLGVAHAAADSRALLLRNHGSLAAAPTLEGAVDAVEEIEESARLHLLLDGRSPRCLTSEDVSELRERPS